ncbi:Ppx/GppA family phosphatase [Campylobacter vulpis]|uniref:Ppx/GppA family phosphatase n=1 Tax=Campylobacter vulpis TaxID=1655500 RepID=A0ABS5P221_9BACT|nr:Ppx/GppA family phosphatase [Campylobacter vulpis]MBS4240707.1 Ppx/GppA family phosphatase [Campylobacter vulpis]
MLGIDLGSNTLRAVVMNEALEKLEEYEFIIAAAKNLSQSKVIGNEAIQRLKNALKELSKKHDLSKALAVATAAFRKAENTNLIFKELKKEFDISFRLISAQTEAKLSVLGMQSGLLALNLHQEFGFCDLGGASCELSFRGNYLSFDFGIISFYESFQTTTNKAFKPLPYFKTKDKKLQIHTLIKDKKLKSLAFRTFEEVKNIKKSLKKQKMKRIVLNSGVPTSLAAFKLGLSYENYDAKKINGTRICAKEFLYFALKLWHMKEDEARFWVGKMRKNYLVAGALLLFALFDKEELIVIDEGLREGVCVAYYKGLF